jgi:LuxR family maltose regulon positive regulatory protein
MAAPILTTKLYIPPARPELVPRPRLIERLNAGLRAACKLILISAPPGFGKTTLLSAWIKDRAPHLRAAWLSLDESDNDPARFLSYLIAALQTVDGGIARGALDALRSPQPPPLEEIVTVLINDIGAIPDVIALVLDDYHLVTAQPIHAAVVFLLDHLPGNLHLVIATRSDPPLPLPRLRARGQLTELRQTDLRFTPDEAGQFLRQVTQTELSADQVAALTFRTEGWIAGLQMATLALQARVSTLGRKDLASFVAAFAGSQHYILDYLMEEVFQRQSESICSFLLHTSILDRLCGPLCDAVLAQSLIERSGAQGPGNSQTMLEHLDHANLFVLPLDDHQRWYRYHRLFADLLQKRLYQAHADLVPTLHRRASEWYEQNGDMAEAIDHALAAGDFERAVHLVEQVAEATLMRSETVTFMNWVDKLPEELVRARPDLGVLHGWALLIGGRPLDVVESRLESIDTSLGVIASKVALLRACFAAFQGRISVTAEMTRQVLEQLPENELFMRINAAWLLSNTFVATGDFPAARQAFGELARTSLQAGHAMIAVGAWTHLAEVHLRLAQTHEAKAAYEKAIDVAADAQGQRLPVAGEALMGLGDLCRELNEPDAALHYTLEGIELSRLWRPVNAAIGYITLARIRQMQGNWQDADEAMQVARQLAAQYDTTNIDDLGVALYRAQLWVKQGHLDAAAQWARERGLDGEVDPAELDRKDDWVSFHLRKYEYLVWVRLLLAQHRPDKALSILEPMHRRMEQQGRTRLLIETLMLKALALRAQGNVTQAMAVLERALSLAEPGGYIRLFADEGPSMARLLREAAAHGFAPKYIAKLLAAFAAKMPGEQRTPETASFPSVSAQSSLVEPLSERELEVLRLLAAGLSNPEIAQELYIAVSTVRSHAKSIYGKLNVHGRWEAVQRAQELGLL